MDYSLYVVRRDDYIAMMNDKADELARTVTLEQQRAIEEEDQVKAFLLPIRLSSRNTELNWHLKPRSAKAPAFTFSRVLPLPQNKRHELRRPILCQTSRLSGI